MPGPLTKIVPGVSDPTVHCESTVTQFLSKSPTMRTIISDPLFRRGGSAMLSTTVYTRLESAVDDMAAELIPARGSVAHSWDYIRGSGFGCGLCVVGCRVVQGFDLAREVGVWLRILDGKTTICP